MDKGAWGHVGVWLGKAALYTAKAAIWASAHPEVIAVIGSVAHVPPPAIKTVEQVATVINTVEQAKGK